VPMRKKLNSCAEATVPAISATTVAKVKLLSMETPLCVLGVVFRFSTNASEAARCYQQNCLIWVDAQGFITAAP
jgi:hypothetical protein